MLEGMIGDVVSDERFVPEVNSMISVGAGGPDRGLLNSRSRATLRGLMLLDGGPGGGW